MEESFNPTTAPAYPLGYASPGTTESQNGFKLGPVGWPMVMFAVVLSCLSLYAVSGPAEYPIPFFAAAIGWIGTMACWVFKAIFSLTTVGRPGPLAPRFGWKSFAVPFLLVATILISTSDLPSKIAFRIARPSMERIARAQLKTPDNTTCRSKVGIYGSCDFRHNGNTVTIQVLNAGYLDSCGYAYCPAGPPSTSGRTTPVGGAWYEWVEYN